MDTSHRCSGFRTINALHFACDYSDALVSGGISHSLNLIDGLNGLAIGVSIVIALGLMSIAVSVGDCQISYILLLIIGALLGLLVFNYPLKLLGDAGYVLQSISWHGCDFVAQ